MPNKKFKLDSVKINRYIITCNKLNIVKILKNIYAQDEKEKEK